MEGGLLRGCRADPSSGLQYRHCQTSCLCYASDDANSVLCLAEALYSTLFYRANPRNSWDSTSFCRTARRRRSSAFRQVPSCFLLHSLTRARATVGTGRQTYLCATCSCCNLLTEICGHAAKLLVIPELQLAFAAVISWCRAT